VQDTITLGVQTLSVQRTTVPIHAPRRFITQSSWFYISEYGGGLTGIVAGSNTSS